MSKKGDDDSTLAVYVPSVSRKGTYDDERRSTIMMLCTRTSCRWINFRSFFSLFRLLRVQGMYLSVDRDRANRSYRPYEESALATVTESWVRGGAGGYTLPADARFLPALLLLSSLSLSFASKFVLAGLAVGCDFCCLEQPWLGQTRSGLTAVVLSLNSEKKCGVSSNVICRVKVKT